MKPTENKIMEHDMGLMWARLLLDADQEYREASRIATEKQRDVLRRRRSLGLEIAQAVFDLVPGDVVELTETWGHDKGRTRLLAVKVADAAARESESFEPGDYPPYISLGIAGHFLVKSGTAGQREGEFNPVRGTYNPEWRKVGHLCAVCGKLCPTPHDIKAPCGLVIHDSGECFKIHLEQGLCSTCLAEKAESETSFE